MQRCQDTRKVTGRGITWQIIERTSSLRSATHGRMERISWVINGHEEEWERSLLFVVRCLGIDPFSEPADRRGFRASSVRVFQKWPIRYRRTSSSRDIRFFWICLARDSQFQFSDSLLSISCRICCCRCIGSRVSRRDLRLCGISGPESSIESYVVRSVDGEYIGRRKFVEIN